MKWRDWLNAAIGIWFVVSPWALGVSDKVFSTWVSVIIGGIQVVTSIWAAYAPDRVGWWIWQNWVSLACGLWFVIHPLAFTYVTDVEFFSMAIPGAVTILLNLWTLMISEQPRRAGNGPKARV